MAWLESHGYSTVEGKQPWSRVLLSLGHLGKDTNSGELHTQMSLAIARKVEIWPAKNVANWKVHELSKGVEGFAASTNSSLESWVPASRFSNFSGEPGYLDFYKTFLCF